ncbi:hypothetical protein D9757_000103 [Collybiopsis confluens]|uniref:Uncharacterized protein n=1 Tax=Collybiopsis confluens TaxID=2823264 RepID=A0A8H5I5K6_9AGAR|nr:hypothetical protein D9757_000103 [Collybiopsis confluens]
MSTITDVSNVLGEYMLKGWILTDESCPNQNCNVPLMRSPDRQLCFCANCDGGPSSQRSSDSSTPSTSHTHSISRSSTPATEMSSLDSFQLPPETPESRRRREQSDQASTEIGKRLLKGWALLGDECWNESCFAVPLVRAPKTAGSKDPRKASKMFPECFPTKPFAGMCSLWSNLRQRRGSCRGEFHTSNNQTVSAIQGPTDYGQCTESQSSIAIGADHDAARGPFDSINQRILIGCTDNYRLRSRANLALLVRTFNWVDRIK